MLAYPVKRYFLCFIGCQKDLKNEKAQIKYFWYRIWENLMFFKIFSASFSSFPNRSGIFKFFSKKLCFKTIAIKENGW
jgi:hypothetical protein